LGDDNPKMIDDPQLLPAITTLCLDGLPEDLIDSLGKLQESPEWQCTDTHWAQTALIVQALHFGLINVSFSVIVGKSKRAVYKEYETTQAQRQANGRSSLLSESQVKAIRCLCWNVSRKIPLQHME
jgi:hypothetical protein